MLKKRKPNSSQNKFLLPFITLGIIMLGIGAWYRMPHNQAGINFVGEATGTVTLALTPSALSLTPNTESTITLTLNSPTSHVTGAQIEIKYDPEKIGTPTVTLGTFLPNVLASAKVAPIDKTSGTISFTVVAPPDSGGIVGSGTLATIKIKPSVIGTSELSFGEMTTVTATEFQTNTLKSATDATITVATTTTDTITSSPATSPSTTASAPIAPQKPSKPTSLQSNCFDGGNKITLRWNSVAGASSYKLRLDQKDGTGDKSIDNITKTEYNFDIQADQKYAWWVHASKDGVDSDAAKIDEIVCPKTTVATAPTPTPSPTSTSKPTVKPTTKPTVKPTSTSTVSPLPLTEELVASPSPIPKPATAQPNLLAKIFLGWQALFENIAHSLFN